MEELIKWYEENVDTSINADIITFLLEKNIISTIEQSEINDVFLMKENNQFVTNNKGKFVMKPNRREFVLSKANNAIKSTKNVVKQHFKLNLSSGNKMKLIKLQ